jgi:hypothetical protein
MPGSRQFIKKKDSYVLAAMNTTSFYLCFRGKNSTQATFSLYVGYVVKSNKYTVRDL